MTLNRRDFLITSALALGSQYAPAEVAAPAPYGTLPAARQVRWQQMETNAFLHFTVNTFTGKEWGDGDENPAVFDPEGFDADSIVQALKRGGMKGVILTCKHHDGFCLWPTKSTERNITKSPWKNGKGDVVREVSDAARRHGLKFGVYVSPWDRNNANYGKPGYIETYHQQLTELLTNYGPVFEVWFDGANGGRGYYGGANETRTIDKHTYYGWPTIWGMVRKMQPDAMIFSDVGPDARWVGNEKGQAGETCWATYDPVGEDGGPAAPGNVRAKESMIGTRNGKQWMPAECDVSIRPGWFWHEAENSKVKTPQQLLDLYYHSVGRGANLLLNLPPNRTGHLSSEDITSLEGFQQRLQTIFKDNLAKHAKLKASNVRGNSKRFAPKQLLDGKPDTYWATDDEVHTPELTLDFGHPVSFNVLRLREHLPLGQRIGAVAFDAWRQGSWQPVAEATSIGNCRLIPLEKPVETTRLRLRVTDSPVCIALSEVGVYLDTASSLV